MPRTSASGPFPIAPHMDDANWLGSDGGEGAGYAYELAAAFASPAVEFNRFLVLHLQAR